MAKIEYKIVERSLYMNEKELNELGAEGWKLNVLMDREDPVRYIFAREVQS